MQAVGKARRRDISGTGATSRLRQPSPGSWMCVSHGPRAGQTKTSSLVVCGRSGHLESFVTVSSRRCRSEPAKASRLRRATTALDWPSAMRVICCWLLVRDRHHACHRTCPRRANRERGAGRGSIRSGGGCRGRQNNHVEKAASDCIAHSVVVTTPQDWLDQVLAVFGGHDHNAARAWRRTRFEPNIVLVGLGWFATCHFICNICKRPELGEESC